MLSEHSIRLTTNYTMPSFILPISQVTQGIICALRRIHIVDRTGNLGNHLGVARGHWKLGVLRWGWGKGEGSGL